MNFAPDDFASVHRRKRLAAWLGTLKGPAKAKAKVWWDDPSVFLAYEGTSSRGFGGITSTQISGIPNAWVPYRNPYANALNSLGYGREDYLGRFP